MKNRLIRFNLRALPRLLRATCINGLLPSVVLLLSVQFSHAGNATWKTNPAAGDWNTAGDWTPATVPNGPSDTATFASLSVTGISASLDTEVNGIVFNAGASAFTISVGTTPTFSPTST
jgi:hypothetical protein